MGFADLSGKPPAGGTPGNNNNNGNGPGGFGIPQGPSGLPPQVPPTPPLSGYSSDDLKDFISQFCINYNEKFATAQHVMFREDVSDTLISVLISKKKPNALLIGPAGSGKTAVVEDLARRIASDDPTLPLKLRGFTVWELQLSTLMAGTRYRGDMEERVKQILEYMQDPVNKAIMFMDEIHMLVNGRNESYNEVANALKPALARGAMRMIGATTLSEAKEFDNDPAFKRRFTRVIVDELSPAQTVEILKASRLGLFQHYSQKILIDDKSIEECVHIADEYGQSGSHRPDNALTLMDRACAKAAVDRTKLEEKAKTDPVAAQMLQMQPLSIITPKLLKDTAIRIATGSNKKADLDPDALDTALSHIKGQDAALPVIKRYIIQNEISVYPHKRPLALLFAGSSGVGKTDVAKSIARVITGIDPIILNMTEYNSDASINDIIGSSAGYVGYDSHREMPFDCLESNPYQVILLDELEKCDKAVQRLFMSVLDEGTLTTRSGKELDFSRTIIIATTNAGQLEKKKHLGFGAQAGQAEPSREQYAKELSKWFDTEFINRFTNIIPFASISKDTYREIVCGCYTKELARIRAERRPVQLPDTIPDDDLDRIVDSTYVESFGARPAAKAVESYINDAAVSQYMQQRQAICALKAAAAAKGSAQATGTQGTGGE